MKIIDIENEINNNNLTKSEILMLYREYLIKLFRNRESMSYEEDYNYHTNTCDTNCYAYSLGIEIPQCITKKTQIDFYPGFISNKNEPKDENEILEGVYSDLDSLHLYYQKAKLNDYDSNKYKIAIYTEIPEYYRDYNSKRDYHFSRQNNDNSWSDKLGYSLKIRQLNYLEDIKGFELKKILKINLRSK